MSFFQNSVLNKYLKTLNTGVVQLSYKKFTTYFHNSEIQNNIREAKEEQFQEGFLRELFVNIFGYTINPDPNYNLTTEFKNLTGSKKADGAILIDGKALAVIELKGTDTRHLDKINEQAFNYKNNQTDCIYVITSNFEKLRFYIHNSVDHLEFNLFTLTEKEFLLLWLCLASESLLKGVPAKVKEESSLVEENITKYLYKDYANFRTDLWQNMVLNNPQVDQLTLFKKTQKLLDRFLFVYFAEDGGLLPPNSITRMVERWQVLKDEDAYKPLYDIFRQFFGYINTGRKGKTENDDIFAFNGGLFLPDEILDTIRIDDEVLRKHTMKLSTYDFLSEVDVNILGHIFENSLNEIENVKALIEGQETDKSKSKRKKDGIFYTPRYITKYIVENTVGKLCEEKKAELNIIDEEYAKGRRNRKKEILHKLDDQLKAYREWLFNITICDPACGSGAFLNQALEFLIEEHRYIDELQAQLLGSSFIFPDVENHILEKNIFGVDINDESVEIARLSLWLRTAQRGRKLTTLNSNIKCGNSLIDDPAVAGDMAFNWQKEFPNVFKKKEKKAYHVVFCLHNSRYSKFTDGLTRRWEYMPGLIGHTHPSLTPKEEIILAECLTDAATEKNLNILECNICEDHVHAIIVCEQQELENQMRLWKGRSSYLYNRRVHPSVEALQYDENYQRDYSDGTIQKFWAKSYHATLIESQEQMFNTVQYIRTNREKHGLQSSTDGVPYSTDGLTRQLNTKTLPPETDGGTHATDGLTRQLQSLVCTPEHAFRNEYKGGFDVVIGNPPYVHLEKLKDLSEVLSKMNYKTFDKRGDLYCLFVEHGFKILKTNGTISFIMPNKWLQAGYGKTLREYFLTYELNQLIDFGDIQIFEGATTYPCIFVSRKAKPKEEFSVSVLTESNKEDFYSNVAQTAESFRIDQFSGETWVISSGIEQKLIERFKKNFRNIAEIVGEKSYRGILTGLSEAFLIDKETKQKLTKSIRNADELIKPFLLGRDVKAYTLPETPNFLILFEKGFTKNKIGYAADENEAWKWIENSYPSIAAWLKPFDERGKNRTDKGDYWWEIRACDYYNMFTVPKIMYQAFQVKPCFIYDQSGLFCNNSMWFIPTNNKGLLAILNSKMGWWLITKYCTQIQNGYQLIWKYFGQIPVPNINEDLSAKANLMLSLHKELQALTNKFSTYFSGQYKLDKLSNKLESWYNLEFPAFISELNKAIKTAKGTPLTKKEEFEWIDLFNENKNKALALKSEIEKTDKEIDRMVYELYGLTEEEIKIVEGA